MNLKEELEKTKTELQEVIKDANDMKGNTFALEMLRELKAQSKRKDIIIIILIGVILAMIISFFIYENQFETITEEQTQEAYYNDNTTITQNIE